MAQDTISLIGVFDGPNPTEQNVEVVQNDDITVTCHLQNADGTAKNIDGALVLTISDRITGSVVLARQFSVTAPSPDGSLLTNFNDAVGPGSYRFDVTYIDVDGKEYHVVPPSKWYVEKAARIHGGSVTPSVPAQPIGVGPAGPQGPAGPAGPQGPQGPAGSGGSGGAGSIVWVQSAMDWATFKPVMAAAATAPVDVYLDDEGSGVNFVIDSPADFDNVTLIGVRSDNFLGFGAPVALEFSAGAVVQGRKLSLKNLKVIFDDTVYTAPGDASKRPEFVADNCTIFGSQANPPFVLDNAGAQITLDRTDLISDMVFGLNTPGAVVCVGNRSVLRSGAFVLNTGVAASVLEGVVDGTVDSSDLKNAPDITINFQFVGDAFNEPFTPSAPADWTPIGGSPVNSGSALDKLAKLSSLRQFDVSQYGDISDGVDHTPAVQAAADACLAYGAGVIVFPRRTTGHWRVGTVNIIGNGFGNLVVIDGSGGYIEPIVAGVDVFHVGNCANFKLRDMTFANEDIGSPVVVNTFVYTGAGSIATVDNVHFFLVRANQGLVRMGCVTNTVRDCMFDGGGGSTGHIYSTGNKLHVDNCRFFDGQNPNSQAWIYIRNEAPPTLDSVSPGEVRISRCSWDEVNGLNSVYIDPSSPFKLPSLRIEGCTSYKNISFPAFDLSHVGSVFIDGCGIGLRYQSVNGVQNPSIKLRDVDYARISSLRTYKNAMTDPATPSCIIDADNTVGHVEIDGESMYDQLATEAGLSFSPVVEVRSGGAAMRVRKATNVKAGALVKADPANVGQVVHLGAADSPLLTIGVADQDTARAQGLFVGVDPTLLANAELWTIWDGINGTVKTFEFHKDGQPATPGLVLVDIQAAVTADDVAAAFAAAINGAHDATWRFTATAVGPNGTITHDQEGEAANLDMGTAGSLLQMRNGGITGGRSYIRVVEVHGQEVTLLSDGTTTIAAGDTVEPSPTVDGRVRKSSGSRVGSALAPAAATVDAAVTAMFTGVVASGGGAVVWTPATLQNGYTPLGAPYADPAFYKDADGVVHLDGAVTGGTSNAVIFTLPVGYRPKHRQVFANIVDNTIGTVTVEANGNVAAQLGSGTTDAVLTFSFVAEQ